MPHHLHQKLLFLLLGILVSQACWNTPSPVTSVPQQQSSPSVDSSMQRQPVPTALPADMIIVTQNGEVTFMGRKIAFDELEKALRDTLVKRSNIPEDIPVQYRGEVLMGVRGDIGSQIKDAIAEARGLQNQPVLDALYASVQKVVTVPVKLQLMEFRTSGEYAFVAGTMLQPDGQPMDYSKTPFNKQAKAGKFSDWVYGLLKKENGAWHVVTQSVGSIDVPFFCWWKTYQVPKALFQEGVLSKDCQ